MQSSVIVCILHLFPCAGIEVLPSPDRYHLWHEGSCLVKRKLLFYCAFVQVVPITVVAFLVLIN